LDPTSTLMMNKTSPSSDKALLTIPEAAKVLGIARTSAYEAVRRGELPALHVGKRVYVPRAQLEAWVGETEPPASSTPDWTDDLRKQLASCMALLEKVCGDPS
jgi:excisionase family DNA binding protein